MYQVTKTYGHELGLSACFRQWRAKSHCAQLHGYALSFKLIFQAANLDENNWVIDFGSLKPVKEYLVNTFDHKLVVAGDDPQLDAITELAGLGIADVLVIENVGCEAFAKMVHGFVTGWLYSTGQLRRVQLLSVEVREHGANSAIYMGRVPE